jgi:hypothetical protein
MAFFLIFLTYILHFLHKITFKGRIIDYERHFYLII